MNIMFVCTGNICRSAMAHWLFEKKIKEVGLENIKVYSSGTYAETNDISTDEAIEVMEEYGVDLKKHRATNLQKSNAKEMDLILCATGSHKMQVLQIYPELKGKVFTMKEYVYEGNEQFDDLNIKDPWGFGIATYRMCAAEIEKVLDLLIKKLEKEKNM